MSGRRTAHEDAHDPVSPWTPRLGDLAHDTATGAVGVVVDVPGEGVYSYHLRPEDAGCEKEWTAPKDGSTLRPAAARRQADER
ncbi:hypothetical protein ABZW10_09815 [Kitasatospora sp. NPDC004723]|uniref:hypothetical protein n=1 Tax=Kitasatospora sp. NPDC004723 TaxID=3154288 RepID=UPI0033A65E85